MKIFIILLLINIATNAMETSSDDKNRPRYHINNKVVYLHETHDTEFQTVSDFNKAYEQQQQVTQETSKTDKISLETSPWRIRLIAAAITGGFTLSAAIISSLVTYYSKTC